MQANSGNSKDVSLALIILLVLQILLAIKVGVFNGLLGGTDVYMWLNRVLDLHAHGDWLDHTLQRINPPYGYEQHWTRPYDFLLYGGAWLGSFVTDFRTALHAWGVLISPVLEILALFTFIWFIKPLTGNRENGIAGLLFVTQMGIIAAFVAGRADHQSLILLLFILSLGIGMRLLVAAFDARMCYLAALVSSLAIWVSVESILFPLIMVGSFGILWLFGHASLQRTLTHFSVLLAFLLVFFRLLEFGPSRFFEPALDQLSIVYITLFGLIALYWTMLSVYVHFRGVEPGTSFKLVSALSWAAVLIGFMHYCYPGFFAGPMSDVDELFQRVHLSKIKELQPAISFAALNGEDWLNELSKFILWVGIIIPGIPLLISRIWKTSDDVQLCWSFIGILCIAYIPLSITELRWAPYTAVLMLPGYIWFVSSLMRISSERLHGNMAGIARISILVGSVVIFALPKVIFSAEEGDAKKVAGCQLNTISAYLRDISRHDGRQQNLLAFTDFGPELIYRTPYTVFSIPSHRYHSGFTNSFMIMTSTNDSEAKQLILEQKVDLILLCPAGHEKHFYETGEGSRPTLHQRLSTGDIPEWLEQVHLPDGLAESFRLYRQRHYELDDTTTN
jgi:hypothetical protein